MNWKKFANSEREIQNKMRPTICLSSSLGSSVLLLTQLFYILDPLEEQGPRRLVEVDIAAENKSGLRTDEAVAAHPWTDTRTADLMLAGSNLSRLP